MHGGSLEIMFTVPLSSWLLCLAITVNDCVFVECVWKLGWVGEVKELNLILKGVYHGKLWVLVMYHGKLGGPGRVSR